MADIRVLPEHLHGFINCSAGLPESSNSSGPKQMRHSGSPASSSTASNARSVEMASSVAGVQSSAIMAAAVCQDPDAAEQANGIK